MEDLGRLAGGVAHEINTPLGIILGYTHLLMDDIKDEELLEDLQIIEKQTKVCRKIVADLLGFSRHSHAVRETVDVNESMREVVTTGGACFFPEPDQNHLVLLMEPFRSLTGDQERLKQVWLNLLNNAADAIGQDGVIYVQSRRDVSGLGLEVSVADTGKGVEKEHLGKIFDPFFTTKQVGKGTGLGLSVSFGIIKEHGGKISALSRPRRNTCPRISKGPSIMVRERCSSLNCPWATAKPRQQRRLTIETIDSSQALFESCFCGAAGVREHRYTYFYGSATKA